MVNQAYVAQNKNGGIVDNWLAEKVHRHSPAGWTKMHIALSFSEVKQNTLSLAVFVTQ